MNEDIDTLLAILHDEDRWNELAAQCRLYPNEPVMHHVEAVFPELIAAFAAQADREQHLDHLDDLRGERGL